MRRMMLVAGCVALAACFSDRSTSPTSNTVDDCDVSLPADLLGSTVVAIRGFAFEPAQVTVTAGTTVTWVNCAPPGEPAHTSTADNGAWSSSLLSAGAVFSFRFPQPGTFAYHCEPHPFMTGEVVVR